MGNYSDDHLAKDIVTIIYLISTLIVISYLEKYSLEYVAIKENAAHYDQNTGEFVWDNESSKNIGEAYKNIYKNLINN